MLSGGIAEISTSIGTAVSQGRNGLGMTIVKGAGNFRDDGIIYDLNADGLTNDTRQVVVAAVNQNGFVSSYSSFGAALLVSGFGSEGELVASDRTGTAGWSDTDVITDLAGTSFATPTVAGRCSPDVRRQSQPRLARRPEHPGALCAAGRQRSRRRPGLHERYTWDWNDADTWNGGGLHFSNDYGYGLVDALAAVRLAETWLVGMAAQTSANQTSAPLVDMLDVATVVPAGETGSTFTGNVTADIEVERVAARDDDGNDAHRRCRDLCDVAVRHRQPGVGQHRGRQRFRRAGSSTRRPFGANTQQAPGRCGWSTPIPTTS